MKDILTQLSETVSAAFEAAGFSGEFGKVTVSNRPDLCEYQCNGAMSAAKAFRRAPMEIAGAVLPHLTDAPCFSRAEAVAPGFLNLDLSPAWLAGLLEEMRADSDRFGVPLTEAPRRILIDYGGPNVAKPLHVGHLRSAVIGESIKRMLRFEGHDVIGDVHLGDWGLQMGLIITELRDRQPELIYFDEACTGPYPEEAPFTISGLEEIYPAASKRSKEDASYKAAAMEATRQLQDGRAGYRALLGHIMSVSVADLKKNYERLLVSFDWWKGESDAQPYIPAMIDRLVAEGFAYESEGALVVDVAEPEDTRTVPPCMLRKSDGASLYTTTDLATLVQREEDFAPDQVIYVVDKRQEMHFIQVFRCAKKTGIVPAGTRLDFLGFGTMNGKDGKPFKTRDGGTMRLSALLEEVEARMRARITEGGGVDSGEAEETARIVGLAALKYGDLSNQTGKDYIFDPERFTSAEGNTGPYILYTAVRMGSVLDRYLSDATDSAAAWKALDAPGLILPPENESERAFCLALASFTGAYGGAIRELAPHRICAWLYELADAFNHFYHENRILGCEDEARKRSWLALLVLARGTIALCADLLGFEIPDHM